MSIQFLTREDIPNTLPEKEKKELQEIADTFATLMNNPEFNAQELWKKAKEEMEELKKK
jgi:hypothetical protein